MLLPILSVMHRFSWSAYESNKYLRKNNAPFLGALHYYSQLPYILYGLTLSCLLFLVGKHLLWFLGNRLTTWIGGNTIWIYLWHIFSIRFFARISNVWLIQYIIVYTSALLIYALQYWMTNSLFKDKQIKRFLVG